MKLTDALFGLTDLKWSRPDIADIQDFDGVTAGGCTYRFEYGAFGIFILQFFMLVLCLFIATIITSSAICQMHYIFC